MTDAVTSDRRPAVCDVLVVGGGLTGLTAGAVIAAERPELTLLVLDAGGSPGGQIRTTTTSGYTFEHGATALTTNRPETLELIRRAGLEDRREPVAPEGRSSSVYVRGALHPVPRSPRALATSPLLPWPGRLRVLAEPLFGRRPPREDETVHEFATRRFGRSAAKLATIALQGVTAGDARETSLEAVWPRLHALDRNVGRRGLLGHAARGGGASGPSTFRDGGLQVLPRTLATALGDRLQRGTAVRELRRTCGDGFTATLADGTSIEARRVVLAIPAAAAAPIVRPLALSLPVPGSAPMRVVGLGYPKRAFRALPTGLGFLSAPGGADGIIGVIVSSNLFPGQAPPGHVLARAFVGGAFAPEAAQAPAIARVERLLHRLYGLHGDADFALDTPWPDGIPQYPREQMARVRGFERALARHPGLHVARSTLMGVGLEEAIAAGTAAARAVTNATTAGAIA
jgi:oxygen-dependent protoporphyrinogen oxidase